jgi:hypothetical protein
VPDVPNVVNVPVLPPLPVTLPTTLPTTIPDVLPATLPLPPLPAVIPVSTQPLVDAYNTAKAAYDDAVAKANAATAALNDANGLLNTAGALVNTILSTVDTQTKALVHAIVDVLGATPLVSIDSFTISTEASARSAGNGGQTAKIVSGEVQGVHVLGNDVLSETLNTDRIDFGQLAGAPLDLVNGQIAALTGALSGVLSGAVPGLSVPAPQVELLSSDGKTGTDGEFGTAQTVVHALKLTIPALSIPAALQTPATVGTLRLHALGDLLSSPLSVAVGTMTDTASFRPAVNPVPPAGTPAAGSTPPGSTPPGSIAAGTPSGSTPSGTTPTGTVPASSVPAGSTPTGSTPVGSTPDGSVPAATPTAAGPGHPQLPRTGLPLGFSLLAFGLCAAGLLLRRRTAAL